MIKKVTCELHHFVRALVDYPLFFRFWNIALILPVLRWNLCRSEARFINSLMSCQNTSSVFCLSTELWCPLSLSLFSILQEVLQQTSLLIFNFKSKNTRVSKSVGKHGWPQPETAFGPSCFVLDALLLRQFFHAR